MDLSPHFRAGEASYRGIALANDGGTLGAGRDRQQRKSGEEQRGELRCSERNPEAPGGNICQSSQ